MQHRNKCQIPPDSRIHIAIEPRQLTGTILLIYSLPFVLESIQPRAVYVVMLVYLHNVFVGVFVYAQQHLA